MASDAQWPAEGSTGPKNRKRMYETPTVRRLGHMSDVAQKSGPSSDVGQPTKA